MARPLTIHTGKARLKVPFQDGLKMNPSQSELNPIAHAPISKLSCGVTLVTARDSTLAQYPNMTIDTQYDYKSDIEMCGSEAMARVLWDMPAERYLFNGMGD